MPARTDTSFTVREEGFDHVTASYREITDKDDGREGFAVDLDCEDDGINLELSLDGAEKLAECILALVQEAKARTVPEQPTPKPTTKPKK